MNLLLRAKLHIYQNRLFQNITGNLPFALNPGKWIFIVGCYNSGTTLLDAILRMHPQISGFPCEGVFLTDSLPYPEQYNWTRMWHKCIDKMRLPLTSEGKLKAQRIQRQWAWCLEEKTDCVVEKSISNATRIPFLNRFFDNSYFIYIVRNGYAVSEGIKRKGKPSRWGNNDYPDGYPLEMCARQWLASDKLVRKDLQCVERYLTITYEDLADNTPLVLGQLSDFLGITHFDKLSLKTRTFSIGGVDSTIKNMNSLSLKNLSKRDAELIREIANDALGRYGYGWA